MSTKVLYLSYDGMMEPLGQSQVLQYVRKLANAHSIILISYEKSHHWQNQAKRNALIEEMKQAGIKWIPLRYHKKPSALATAYDIFIGLAVGSYVVLTQNVKIVHARSYVAAVIALVLKKLWRRRFIFDMRGFWVDERVDGGLWPKDSRLYRLGKWFEQRFLLNADTVVSLTREGVKAIKRFPYMQKRLPKFEVITTCTNLDLFRPSVHINRDRPFTLGYVGTVGVWYLFNEVLETFKILRTMLPDARLTIINREEHDYIRDQLKEYGIPEAWVEIKAAEYSQIPQEMQRMDVGVFFIKPVFSKLASAPTKLGEFLACGIPCLSNAGVGDLESLLEGQRVGIILSEFTAQAKEDALRRLLKLTQDPDIKKRCVHVAKDTFSLERGISVYDRIYCSLEEA